MSFVHSANLLVYMETRHIPTEIMRQNYANSRKIKMYVFYSSESDQHELEGVGRRYREGLLKLDVDNRVAVS